MPHPQDKTPESPAEHVVYLTMSLRMLAHEEVNPRKFWPAGVQMSGHGLTRWLTIDHEDFEDVSDWLAQYGCCWQEE